MPLIYIFEELSMFHIQQFLGKNKKHKTKTNEKTKNYSFLV